jgi:hypothetical protein
MYLPDGCLVFKNYIDNVLFFQNPYEKINNKVLWIACSGLPFGVKENLLKEILRTSVL